MKQPLIFYKSGYKYQLTRDYTCFVGIFNYDFENEFFKLTATGWLTIKRGYAWDGCSGCTLDTKTNMRGGLVHDALYQLMRMGVIAEKYVDKANELFKQICREDGMCWIRSQLYFWGVNTSIAEKNAKVGTEQKEQSAP